MESDNRAAETGKWRTIDCRPDVLRRDLCSFMSTKRMSHVLEVERDAMFLAKQWGVDPEKASLAALLHDITKECGNQLKLLEEYGILPSILENILPGVAHAVTAAALARRLGVSPEVCDAIRWHTTGRAGMTDLDIILYLSDMTEPLRTPYPGLDALRTLCRTDLYGALRQGLRLSLNHIQRRGLPVDPHSRQALAWITERLFNDETQRKTD